MMYRIVNTDNLGVDYPNESFTDDEPFETEDAAQFRADELNVYERHQTGLRYSLRYFKVVEMPYKLQPVTL